MLQITVDGRPLDLEGIKFTLQLNSPFPFDPVDNTIEGSFAFGAIFPASDLNKEIFDFPHRLEKFPDTPVDLSGILFFAGRKLFEITISLQEVTARYFNTNIKVGVGYYANLIADKSLRDLSYGGDIDLGSTAQDVVDHAMANVSQSYPLSDYCFPGIRNPDFYDEDNAKSPEYCGWMNYYLHGEGFQVNEIDAEGAHNKYNLVPCFFLMYVMKQCFQEHGYRPAGKFFEDPELQRLFIYNNFALDLVEDRYKSMAELSEDQFIDEPTKIPFDREVLNIDSCYDDQEYAYRVLKPRNHRVTAKIDIEGIIATPGFTVQWYVDVYMDGDIINTQNGEIMYETQVEVNVNFDILLDDMDFGKYIYIKIRFKDNFNEADSTGNVFQNSWFSVQNIYESELNRYKTSITPSNHMPDIKVSEYLLRNQKLFGIVYDIDHVTKQVNVLFLTDILGQFASAGYDVKIVKSSKSAGFKVERSYKLVFDWLSSDGYTKDNFQPWDSSKLFGRTGFYPGVENLPEVVPKGSLAIIQNLNAIYIYGDYGWVWHTDNFLPYTIGAGKTEIKPAVSPLTMCAEYQETPGIFYVYPRIKQKGSGQVMGNNDFGFHLLFYWQLKPDRNDDTYPFASSARFSPKGTVLGNYELRWDGDHGLYENFLRHYYAFIMDRSRPAEYERHFTASEIQKISFMEKVKIFESTFLIKQVSIPISESSIGTSRMKLIKS